MSRLPSIGFPAIKPRQNRGQYSVNIAPTFGPVIFILKVSLVDAIALASKLIEGGLVPVSGNGLLVSA